jgi:hypothetical protein
MQTKYIEEWWNNRMKWRFDSDTRCQMQTKYIEEWWNNRMKWRLGSKRQRLRYITDHRNKDWKIGRSGA